MSLRLMAIAALAPSFDAFSAATATRASIERLIA
jgi:hypothetical protein